jgi:hypothetical protein
MLWRRSCWQCELLRFLTATRNTRFAYGTFDCCLFACDAIKAMTGTDIAAAFRGTYTTGKAAHQLHGSVRTIAETVTTQFEMPAVPVLLAQRGDLVLIKRARDYSLGVVDLKGQIAIALRTGNGRIPLERAAAAWRV